MTKQLDQQAVSAAIAKAEKIIGYNLKNNLSTDTWEYIHRFIVEAWCFSKEQSLGWRDMKYRELSKHLRAITDEYNSKKHTTPLERVELTANENSDELDKARFLVKHYMLHHDPSLAREMSEILYRFLKTKGTITSIEELENITDYINYRYQKEFEELGYQLKHKILNAVDYGVPQQRERVILVGFLNNNNFEYPSPTHGEGLTPYLTLKDALGDLPVLDSGQTNNEYATQANNDFLKFVRMNGTTVLDEHSSPKNGEHLIKIMQTLKDGQSKDDLPEEIRPKSGYGNTYAKLWWNRPSTTITRNFACPSSSRCIHPRDSRAMSIREGARLQSFPDNYKFYGSDGMKRLEIGNAVPPLLSIEIAKAMLKALDERK